MSDMMSSEELMQWRDIERGKLSQLMSPSERRASEQIISVLTAVLGDDQ